MKPYLCCGITLKEKEMLLIPLPVWTGCQWSCSFCLPACEHRLHLGTSSPDRVYLGLGPINEHGWTFGGCFVRLCQCSSSHKAAVNSPAAGFLSSYSPLHLFCTDPAVGISSTQQTWLWHEWMHPPPVGLQKVCCIWHLMLARGGGGGGGNRGVWKNARFAKNPSWRWEASVLWPTACEPIRLQGFVLWTASPFNLLFCKQARQNVTDFPFYFFAQCIFADW